LNGERYRQKNLGSFYAHFGNRTISGEELETPDFADPHRCGGAVIGDCWTRARG